MFSFWMQQKISTSWGYSLTRKAFIFSVVCLFSCEPKFFNAGLFFPFTTRRRCRWAWAFDIGDGIGTFLFSLSFLVADSKKSVFAGLTADLRRKIAEKHLVLNRKLGLIWSDLNETTQRFGGGPILQLKNYLLNSCWCYRGNPTAVRIILRNVYCVSTVLTIQEVKPKEHN